MVYSLIHGIHWGRIGSRECPDHLGWSGFCSRMTSRNWRCSLSFIDGSTCLFNRDHVSLAILCQLRAPARVKAKWYFIQLSHRRRFLCPTLIECYVWTAARLLWHCVSDAVCWASEVYSVAEHNELKLVGLHSLKKTVLICSQRTFKNLLF